MHTQCLDMSPTVLKKHACAQQAIKTSKYLRQKSLKGFKKSCISVAEDAEESKAKLDGRSHQDNYKPQQWKNWHGCCCYHPALPLTSMKWLSLPLGGLSSSFWLLRDSLSSTLRQLRRFPCVSHLETSVIVEEEMQPPSSVDLLPK